MLKLLLRMITPFVDWNYLLKLLDTCLENTRSRFNKSTQRVFKPTNKKSCDKAYFRGGGGEMRGLMF